MRQARVSQRFIVARQDEAAIPGYERRGKAARALACRLVDCNRKAPPYSGKPEARLVQGTRRRTQRSAPASALDVSDAAQFLEPGLPAEIILPCIEGAGGGRKTDQQRTNRPGETSRRLI